MTTAYFTFERKGPLALFTIHSISPTLAHIDELLAACDLVLSGEKSVTILDLRQAKMLSAEARIKIGNWMKSHQARVKERMYGFCYVVPSVLIEMTLRGIFLISKPPVPYKVSPKIEVAFEWAEDIALAKV